MISLVSSFPWRAAAAPLAGLILALGFAQTRFIPGIAGLVVFLMLSVTAPRPRRAFLDGWIAGFTFFGWLLSWFAMAIILYSELGGFLALMAVLFSSAGLALGFGVTSWGAARWAGRWGRGPSLVAGALLFLGYEILRVKYPVPFPWGTLSASAAGLKLGFLAAGLGSVAVSLFLALTAAGLAGLFLRAPGRIWLMGTLVALLVLLGVGWWRVPAPLTNNKVKLALLQGSVEREDRGTEGLSVYRDLTWAAARAGAEVIVWPEGATPFQIDDDPAYRDFLESLAANADVELVLNSLTNDGRGGWENSAILITPRGGWVNKAPKRQLVPFGEYVPWRWLLGKIPALAHEIGDLSPGKETVVFNSRAGRLGPLVCFEAVFSGLTCDYADRGADILVNMTNDSWFGISNGPAQHLDHGRGRTWETHRPMVRAANSGISAVIDAEGRIQGSLPVGERGFLIAEVSRVEGTSPGCRASRVLRPLCATLSLLALAGAVFGFRRGGPKTKAHGSGSDNAG